MPAPVLVAALLALGCKDDPKPPASSPSGSAGSARGPRAPDVLEGTLAVDGTARTLVACRPQAAVHVFVEVVTAAGTLRFEDQRLSWDGEPLTCKQLDRSWGGGRRPGGDAYWRGTLAFDCVAGARTVTGDLRLDCGDITAEERAQLDANRQQLLDEQRGAGAR